MTHEELEEGKVLKLDFAKLRKVANCESDVLPAIAQDAQTGEVLIVGYANELALQTALETLYIYNITLCYTIFIIL
mgnify:CR=1 FL=1